MPTQDRVGREQAADLLQYLPAQDSPLHGQPATLIIVEQDSFLPELLLQHVDLRPLKVNDLLLLLVDPAGENHQQKLPGMEDETHDAPRLKLSRENFSVGWGRAVVNRPKRAPDARP